MTAVSEIKIAASLAELDPPKPNLWLTAVLGACVGLAAFFALGLQHILPPHNIGWLLAPSKVEAYWDPATYYLGWDFYRHAPWKWPVGLNSSYGMERATSIAFSDSLPLLAYVFKPFSRWLGEDFQYIGIWILMCYMLQGMFAALIASRFAKGLMSRLLIAALFAGSPLIVERAYTSFTLMGHWLILWGIYLYLCEYRGRFRWVWMIVPSLAVLTHAYMLPMILALWGADALKRSIYQPRRIPFLFVEAVGVLGAVWLVMKGTGYFLVPDSDANVSGFGALAINVLGPIDPWHWSLFLQPQPKGPHWSGEGYSYFGAGMLIACCIAFYEVIRAGVSWRVLWKSIPRRSTPPRGLLYILPLVLVCVGLTLFALSDKIAFGSHEFESPINWGRLGRVFRSSGRMFWAPYYAIWVGALYLLARGLKKWPGVVVLTVLLVVQIIDLSPQYEAIRDLHSRDLKWETPLRSPFWDAAAKKYNTVVVVPSWAVISVEQFQYVPIAYYASKHRMRTNVAYIARIPLQRIIDVNFRREQDMVENRLKPQILYIIPNQRYFEILCSIIGTNHGVGRIDGYNVIAPFWFTKGRPVVDEFLTPAGPAHTHDVSHSIQAF